MSPQHLGCDAIFAAGNKCLQKRWVYFITQFYLFQLPLIARHGLLLRLVFFIRSSLS